MNIDEIIQLIQAVSENKLTSLEFEDGGMKLSLKCEKDQPRIVSVSAPSMDQTAVQSLNTATGPVLFPALNAPGAAFPLAQAQETPGGSRSVDIGSDKVITSPLVGTFYISSSPNSEAFVEVGDRVKKGQVMGIIEAMKLMNEIESEYDGVVEAILVSNEDVVEFGQPLFRIR